MLILPDGVSKEGNEVDLFSIDGETISVKILNATQSIVWIEKHGEKIIQFDEWIQRTGKRHARLSAESDHCEDDEYDGKIKAVDKAWDIIKKHKADRFKAVIEALKAYDSKVFTAELFKKANTAQVMDAYMILYVCTDPTQATSALMLARVAETKEAMGQK